jgi:hypothetical protein
MKKNKQLPSKNILRVLQNWSRTGIINYPPRLTMVIFLLVAGSLSAIALDPFMKNTLIPERKMEIKQLNDPIGPIDQENNKDSPITELFNGNDLSGWCYHNKISENIILEPFKGKTESSDGRFMAKDSMLTINPWDEAKGPHWVNLWSSLEFSSDFMLTIEFRASPNADSGIFLRGKQLQCRDYLLAGPYRELKKYRPQDWNKIEVVVKNNVAHCTCNGEVLEEALQIPPKGSIGLEADRGRMDYRNILLRLL